MNPPKKVTYTGAYVFARDLAYVKGVVDTLNRDRVDHTAILRWSNGTWGQYMIPGCVASHCVIPESDRTVLCLVIDGSVHRATPNGFSWEHIDESEAGPNLLRHMTDIRPIGQSVYAAGMARMVYKRSGPGSWSRFDNGMRSPRSDPHITGFLSIDGCDEGSIYAVGFKGEMWYYDGKKWNPIDSPTNVKLEQVRCISPEQVFACGARGIVLKGNRDRWSVVSHDATTKTLWGMEYFQESIYLADHSAIYTLKKDTLHQVDVGLNKEITTRNLHAKDGSLWSVGDKHIMVFDGRKWTELTP